MKKTFLPPALVVSLFCLMTFFASAQGTTLKGIVSYHNDGIRVLPNVSVLLYDAGGNILAYTLSDETGYYEFTNLPNGNYTLTGTYDTVGGGISVASALYIHSYLIGQQDFTNIQKLAADVNGDNLVTFDDYNTIMAHYLVYGQAFPAGEWKFETLAVEINGLKSNNVIRGLGGTSTGDTGGAFVPTLLDSPVLYFANESIYEAKSNEMVDIAIKASETFDMAGMHLRIGFPEQLVEIISIETNCNDLHYNIEPGMITLSAANAGLLNTTFHAGDDILRITGKVSGSFSVNDRIEFTLSPESHFVDGNSLDFISPKITHPVIEYRKEKSELLANYPNPFSSQTSINYRIGTSSHVNISLVGMDGRLVQTIVDEFKHEGIYQVNLLRGNLAPGTYLLRMKTAGEKPINNSRVIVLTSH